MLYTYESKYQEAAKLMQQALVIREALFGSNHPDTQSSRQSLIVIEQRLASLDKEADQ